MVNQTNVLRQYLLNHSAKTFAEFEKTYRDDIGYFVNKICNKLSIFLIEDREELTQDVLIKLANREFISKFSYWENQSSLKVNFAKFLYAVIFNTARTSKRKISKYRLNLFALEDFENEMKESKTLSTQIYAMFNFSQIFKRDILEWLNEFRSKLNNRQKEKFDIFVAAKIDNLPTAEIEKIYKITNVGQIVHQMKNMIKSQLKAA